MSVGERDSLFGIIYVSVILLHRVIAGYNLKKYEKLLTNLILISNDSLNSWYVYLTVNAPKNSFVEYVIAK